MKIVVVLSLVCVGLAAAAKLPKTWRTCSRSDPKIKECLAVAVQEVLLELATGNSQMGVIPLDPLHFNELHIKQAAGPVQANLTFVDIDVKQTKNVHVTVTAADWDKYHIAGTLKFDKPVELVGGYEVNGKVLVLPIQGKGPCRIVFYDFVAELDIKGKPLVKNGKTYFDVTDPTIMIEAQNMDIRLENLFNGDKALGDNMNKFLNENSKDIMNEIRGSISEALALAIKQIANQIFHKVPLDDIAPK